MGREVRKVPPDWEHPKDGRGRFIPLLGYDFAQTQADWEEQHRQWQMGMRKDYANDGWRRRNDEEMGMTFEEWHGERPDPEDYMPQWKPEEATHLMMYECTSEGTPISPAFATPEELAQWLVDNHASAFADQTASYEGWLRMAQGAYAPSAVFSPGKSLTSGVEAMKTHPD